MNELTNVQKMTNAYFRIVSAGSRSFELTIHTIMNLMILFSQSRHHLYFCRSIEQYNRGRPKSKVVRITGCDGGSSIKAKHLH